MTKLFLIHTELPLPQNHQAGQAEEEEHPRDHRLPLCTALVHLSKALIEADAVHCQHCTQKPINSFITKPIFVHLIVDIETYKHQIIRTSYFCNGCVYDNKPS